MGNDGGSIPKRDDLVKTKHRAEQVDQQQKESTRWECCALSKSPLEEPIVSDPLGKLYNKSSVLTYLLNNKPFGEDGRQVAGHLVGLRDLVDLQMTRNQQTARWICPISLKEMGSGIGKMELRWIYVVGCGCVLTEVGFKQVQKGETSDKLKCPVCGKSQEILELVTINPSDVEEEQMRIKLVERRKNEKLIKEQRKLEKKQQKKRKKNETQDPGTSELVDDSNELNKDGEEDRTKSKKKSKLESHKSQAGSGPSSCIASSSSSRIYQEVQKEVQQSVANLSSSTQSSIYGPRDENGKQLLGQQKESWMTRGTWTRYAS